MEYRMPKIDRQSVWVDNVRVTANIIDKYKTLFPSEDLSNDNIAAVVLEDFERARFPSRYLQKGSDIAQFERDGVPYNMVYRRTRNGFTHIYDVNKTKKKLGKESMRLVS